MYFKLHKNVDYIHIAQTIISMSVALCTKVGLLLAIILLFMPRIVLIFKQIAYLCKAKR